MGCQPFLHLRVRMRAIVVKNQMNFASAWNATVDLLEELHKFLVPMTGLVLANDRSVQNIQGSEQGSSSISLIVVCLAFGNAWSHWQQRLCPVECLDLAFFIY